MCFFLFRFNPFDPDLPGQIRVCLQSNLFITTGQTGAYAIESTQAMFRNDCFSLGDVIKFHQRAN